MTYPTTEKVKQMRERDMFFSAIVKDNCCSKFKSKNARGNIIESFSRKLIAIALPAIHFSFSNAMWPFWHEKRNLFENLRNYKDFSWLRIFEIYCKQILRKFWGIAGLSISKLGAEGHVCVERVQGILHANNAILEMKYNCMRNPYKFLVNTRRSWDHLRC